jgi:hypothetical protein
MGGHLPHLKIEMWTTQLSTQAAKKLSKLEVSGQKFTGREKFE